MRPRTTSTGQTAFNTCRKCVVTSIFCTTCTAILPFHASVTHISCPLTPVISHRTAIVITISSSSRLCINLQLDNDHRNHRYFASHRSIGAAHDRLTQHMAQAKRQYVGYVYTSQPHLKSLHLIIYVMEVSPSKHRRVILCYPGSRSSDFVRTPG